MATPRVAAGALFLDEQGRVLIVRPSYKPYWDIPGGYVEPGETPSQACRREVKEELAIDVDLRRVLVVDLAPNEGEGDKMLFIFDGGGLSAPRLAAIRLAQDELQEWSCIEPDRLADVMVPRLARRLSAAVAARKTGHVQYLEHGMRFPGDGAS
jgi:ADP-ribose pyrophosphatase YjhB (NUDIX family)